MRQKIRCTSFVLPVLLVLCWVIPAAAEVYVQCPCLLPNPVTGKPDPTLLAPAGLNPATGNFFTTPAYYNTATQNIECAYIDKNAVAHNAACKALSAGDGHVNMADGNDIFIFGFDDVTGVPVDQVMNMANDPIAPGGKRGAEASAPTINIQGGQEFYLSLTNEGMFERPDLADPHTVHYHGFPNASSVFDGEPMASIAINMGETLTYYYNNAEPGTYMYHCHVEASEHMQMGMLGNLYVRPQQDGTSITYNGKPHTLFAYNDCPTYPTLNSGCGKTGYDISYPLQITAFDPDFHHNDNSYNDLDFGNMRDAYTLFNGRGYPDTINTCTDGKQTSYPVVPAGYPACTSPLVNILGISSQNVSSAIYAAQGQKILLHFPSLATSEFYTVTLLGLKMQVVGQGARQLKGPTGVMYDYYTNSITLGGGEANDILIDTSNAQKGTYFLYTANLTDLSNDAQDFGGMMTEIVIN